MNIIQRVETEARLWRILLPFCPAPSEYQFGTWARQFSDGGLEYAFTRAAKKFNPSKGRCPSAETVHRYVTGILVNEHRAAAVAS